MTVVFGNLADVYGRKPVMLVGIGIFLLGSLGAGFAGSMPAMICWRIIQGIGAGAMQPVAMTIVADLYPARERGKIQGYLASVWAVAAVVGPVFGGLIIHSVSWAWIFWINIPVGVAAAAGYILFLKDIQPHERRSTDVGGAIAFTVAVTSLLIALTEVGNQRPTQVAAAAALSCIATVVFVLLERRVSNPMVSFALWSHRPIAATNGVAVLASMALIGLTTFLPIYVQIVMQHSPTTAGLALTTMLVGWPAGAIVAARLFHRFALRHLLVCGALLQPLGAIFFVALTPHTSPLVAATGSLVMGFGMGLISVSSLVLIQEIVDSAQRGRVTASNVFSRNLGSTLGATVLGAVLNHSLSRSGTAGPITSDQLRQLLNAPGLTAGDAQVRFAMEQGAEPDVLGHAGIDGGHRDARALGAPDLRPGGHQVGGATAARLGKQSSRHPNAGIFNAPVPYDDQPPRGMRGSDGGIRLHKSPCRRCCGGRDGNPAVDCGIQSPQPGGNRRPVRQGCCVLRYDVARAAGHSGAGEGLLQEHRRHG